MSNSMFEKGSIPALEMMVRFTSARHKVLAGNVANVETVGYKALDVPEEDFKKAMARAFEEQRRTPTGVFEMEPCRDFRFGAGGLDMRLQESRDAGILKHIENNVDLDIEMGKMVKNGMTHNFAASLLAHQFSQLRAAISERIMG